MMIKEQGLKMELREQIEAIAIEAGKIMLSADSIQAATDEKSGHANFVTMYDKKIQEFLFAELARVLPEASFVGEEEGAESFREEYRKGYAFVIDPIDGTTNFIKAYRPSVTSIGLLLDGKPNIGVVYNPYQGIMYSAERGKGSYRNGIRIYSSEEPLARSIFSMGTAPYYEELTARSFRIAEKYLHRTIDMRRSGTAAWDLCLLATGITGLYYELKLGLWDFTAGAIIAEEAGCVLTDIDGNPLTYDGPSSVLAVSRGVARENYLPEA
jgi:myo-inositol-1(or 4)-monophosphatase